RRARIDFSRGLWRTAVRTARSWIDRGVRMALPLQSRTRARLVCSCAGPDFDENVPMTATSADELKKAAAEAAARRVVSGMLVGLGTGSTAIHAVPYLAHRLKSGELRDIRAVPTSFQSLMLARQLGIPLIDLDQVDRIDLAIDGADEVAPDLTLIKGA